MELKDLKKGDRVLYTNMSNQNPTEGTVTEVSDRFITVNRIFRYFTESGLQDVGWGNYQGQLFLPSASQSYEENVQFHRNLTTLRHTFGRSYNEPPVTPEQAEAILKIIT